ncbi:MAG: hypothetical protein MJ252_15265 [archaeon]|nr:hypothetical protein [archaeon]
MNSNFYFTAQNKDNVPAAYIPDVLEGNWYEDRCISDYDKKKKRDFMLPNPNAWMYDTTYNEYGQQWKNFPSTKEHFAIANDNYISFSGKDNNMYVTTNKHAYDDKYKMTFRKPIDMKDYYKNKPEELEKYRQTWTKKEQRFDTTYKNDLIKVIKDFPNENLPEKKY